MFEIRHLRCHLMMQVLFLSHMKRKRLFGGVNKGLVWIQKDVCQQSLLLSGLGYEVEGTWRFNLLC